MNVPEIDDFVLLRVDRPDHDLSAGDIGIIRKAWAAPHQTYEVEFIPRDAEWPVRLLLSAAEVELAPRLTLGDDYRESPPPPR